MSFYNSELAAVQAIRIRNIPDITVLIQPLTERPLEKMSERMPVVNDAKTTGGNNTNPYNEKGIRTVSQMDAIPLLRPGSRAGITGVA
jgi:hypothetical protein